MNPLNGLRGKSQPKESPSNQSPHQALRELIEVLLSPNREVRIHGLETATKLAILGDKRGLEALEEAIRVKAGSRDIEFYQPNRGRFRHAEESVTSRADLLRLSRSKALLKDPKVTGNLITAFIHDNDAYKINKFAEEIGVEGGEDQFHAFQLIYSQLHALTYLQKPIYASKELYHIFLVWSHPESPDQLKFANLILSVIQDYSERSKLEDGKVGTVWITDPIDSYDIEKVAIEFLGTEIIDSDKFEIEIKGFTDGTGNGRCLIVYKYKKFLVPESDVAIYVFDYHKMDSQYGHQAFKAIQRGLALSIGSCGFSDGDLEVPARSPSGVPKVLMQLKESGCRIEPISQESPLNNLDSVSHIYGYAAAMWTDYPLNIPLLHDHLKSTRAAGYLGCIVLPEKVGGHMQFYDFVRPLSLMVGINFIDGKIVPLSSKYGIR